MLVALVKFKRAWEDCPSGFDKDLVIYAALSIDV